MRRLVVMAIGSLTLIALGAAIVPTMMVAAIFGGSASSSFAAGLCSIDDGATASETLTAAQARNAETIVAVGKSVDVAPRGWVVAIASALQESGLRNLNHGDRDSLGLFQQRPSAGWGSRAQVMDPTYAARAFYGGPTSPTNNRGLLDIRGWESMPLWQAAQSVQRSAFPHAYERHEQLAVAVVRQIAGTASDCEPPAVGPWSLPIAGPYTLTSGFGPRRSPTTGAHDFHTGQDFAVPTGTSAHAVTAGFVVFTGWSGGYGKLVRLRHAGGVESWYAHLSRIDVIVGAQVDGGGVIARTGSTGNSTGPHLHLEVRVDGHPTDPIPWLKAKGLTP